MTREKAITYVDDALEALGRCKTDAALIRWDDNWMTRSYIGLPDDLAKKLDQEFARRDAIIHGLGIE